MHVLKEMKMYSILHSTRILYAYVRCPTVFTQHKFLDNMTMMYRPTGADDAAGREKR